MAVRYLGFAGNASTRVWSFVAVVVLHAVALFALLMTKQVIYNSQPEDIQIKFVPKERPDESSPSPETQTIHLSSDMELQLPPTEVNVMQVPVPVVEDSIEDVPSVLYTGDSLAITPETGFTSKPQPISRPHGMESYPVESIRARESGKTTLEICISEAGEVSSIKVAKSSGFPRLDKAAISVASDYRFKPALLHGKPVVVCLPYVIGFSLNGVRQMQPQREAQKLAEKPDEMSILSQAPGNPDIERVARPVRMQTYLDAMKDVGVDCTPLQLRIIGQLVKDKRHVIEAQCSEQPKGLVALIPLGDSTGKFEILDCAAALSRRINCEFSISR